MKRLLTTQSLYAWLTILLLPMEAWAQTRVYGPTVAGIPMDFILFGATLIGVALFHNRVLLVASSGLLVIILYKRGGRLAPPALFGFPVITFSYM